MTQPADSSDAAPGNLYVYGVVRADATLPLRDVPAVEEAAPVQLVARGDVAALVSPVSPDLFSSAGGDDLGWLEAPVRAHEAVLELALTSGPVVPMRFGTVVAGADGLGAYLDEHGERLSGALRELDGKREWGVRATADERALREPTGASGGGSAPESEGAAYLARKRAERQAAEAVAGELDALAADLHARLAARAARTALLSNALPRRDDGRRAVLNAAYLVPVEDEDAFRAAVEELRVELASRGVDLALTGPWPPYSFVGEEES